MSAPNVGDVAIVDLRHLARLGRERRDELKRADAVIDAVADELIEVLDGGGEVNMELAVRTTGIAKTTLRRRIAARRNANQEDPTG